MNLPILIDIDTRERAIKRIVEFFDKNNIQHFSHGLPVGDYASWDNPRQLVIDRKLDLSEVYRNLCHEKKRIAAEMLKAQQHSTKLIFLVEHGGQIKTLEDVKHWKNPQLEVSPYAWDGKRLYKEMCTVAEKYGVEWQFCNKRQTGRRILEILEAGRDRL